MPNRGPTPARTRQQCSVVVLVPGIPSHRQGRCRDQSVLDHHPRNTVQPMVVASSLVIPSLVQTLPPEAPPTPVHHQRPKQAPLQTQGALELANASRHGTCHTDRPGTPRRAVPKAPSSPWQACWPTLDGHLVPEPSPAGTLASSRGTAPSPCLVSPWPALSWSSRAF